MEKSEMYYIVKAELSNGFVNVNVIGWAHGLTDAANRFHAEVQKELADWENRKWNALGDFDFLGEDGKGNGVHIVVCNETDMMEYLIDKVNNSKTTYEFEHIGCEGEETYSIEEPCLNLDFIPCDAPDGKLDYIGRRPYDTENKNDTEYVYDVFSVNADGNVCVDSLEVIPTLIFGFIYYWVKYHLPE